ncbi:hypothetical protein K490DRAFT_55387 [Saccharata proteae CBS 121410]|uniref:Uncharacterized protein n=1 Tax=Saccharata proteae CBS 121410 TaxID=1314787 RepID=A0A6A5YAM7_9PEZI|nr:hypothetical protein K490DRAFT_55387 [Saccharata proteae CBS 121410]
MKTRNIKKRRLQNADPSTNEPSSTTRSPPKKRRDSDTPTTEQVAADTSHNDPHPTTPIDDDVPVPRVTNPEGLPDAPEPSEPNSSPNPTGEGDASVTDTSANVDNDAPEPSEPDSGPNPTGEGDANVTDTSANIEDTSVNVENTSADVDNNASEPSEPDSGLNPTGKGDAGVTDTSVNVDNTSALGPSDGPRVIPPKRRPLACHIFDDGERWREVQNCVQISQLFEHVERIRNPPDAPADTNSSDENRSETPLFTKLSAPDQFPGKDVYRAAADAFGYKLVEYLQSVKKAIADGNTTPDGEERLWGDMVIRDVAYWVKPGESPLQCHNPYRELKEATGNAENTGNSGDTGDTGNTGDIENPGNPETPGNPENAITTGRKPGDPDLPDSLDGLGSQSITLSTVFVKKPSEIGPAIRLIKEAVEKAPHQSLPVLHKFGSSSRRHLKPMVSVDAEFIKIPDNATKEMLDHGEAEEIVSLFTVAVENHLLVVFYVYAMLKDVDVNEGTVPALSQLFGMVFDYSLLKVWWNYQGDIQVIDNTIAHMFQGTKREAFEHTIYYSGDKAVFRYFMQQHQMHGLNYGDFLKGTLFYDRKYKIFEWAKNAKSRAENTDQFFQTMGPGTEEDDSALAYNLGDVCGQALVMQRLASTRDPWLAFGILSFMHDTTGAKPKWRPIGNGSASTVDPMMRTLFEDDPRPASQYLPDPLDVDGFLRNYEFDGNAEELTFFEHEQLVRCQKAALIAEDSAHSRENRGYQVESSASSKTPFFFKTPPQKDEERREFAKIAVERKRYDPRKLYWPDICLKGGPNFEGRVPKKFVIRAGTSHVEALIEFLQSPEGKNMAPPPGFGAPIGHHLGLPPEYHCVPGSELPHGLAIYKAFKLGPTDSVSDDSWFYDRDDLEHLWVKARVDRNGVSDVVIEEQLIKLCGEQDGQYRTLKALYRVKSNLQEEVDSEKAAERTKFPAGFPAISDRDDIYDPEGTKYRDSAMAAPARYRLYDEGYIQNRFWDDEWTSNAKRKLERMEAKMNQTKKQTVDRLVRRFEQWLDDGMPDEDEEAEENDPEVPFVQERKDNDEDWGKPIPEPSVEP